MSARRTVVATAVMALVISICGGIAIGTAATFTVGLFVALLAGPLVQAWAGPETVIVVFWGAASTLAACAIGADILRDFDDYVEKGFL